jgi:membrane fusion protein, multidrug efflux system
VKETNPDKHGSSRIRAGSIAIAAVGVAALAISWAAHSGNPPGEAPHRPPPPQVGVSRPLVMDLDTRLGFLGQFSAVDRVEIRPQVGGTLTGIYFTDGAIVHKGDRLFSIDPEPYAIKLAQAKAEMATATARLELANQELRRARELQQNEAGTVQDVDQRTSEQRAAQASVDNAAAAIRDASFDLNHCVIVAPFAGRIGSHLVSVGNLIAGSRAATSPTTLLATLVSLDPIYLNFDMSEADYQRFQRYRAQPGQGKGNTVRFTLSDSTGFAGSGNLDFVDNQLDRASGTIRARATVRNPDLSLTPGEFSRIRLVVSQPVPTLLVPDSSVLPDQSEHIVLTVSSAGMVVPKHVEIGDERDGLRVIKSGLSSTDKVIVDGIPFAVPGSKVRQQEGKISDAATRD